MNSTSFGVKFVRKLDNGMIQFNLKKQKIQIMILNKQKYFFKMMINKNKIMNKI